MVLFIFFFWDIFVTMALFCFFEIFLSFALKERRPAVGFQRGNCQVFSLFHCFLGD